MHQTDVLSSRFPLITCCVTLWILSTYFDFAYCCGLSAQFNHQRSSEQTIVFQSERNVVDDIAPRRIQPSLESFSRQGSFADLSSGCSGTGWIIPQVCHRLRGGGGCISIISNSGYVQVHISVVFKKSCSNQSFTPGILGSSELIGSWNANKVKALRHCSQNVWATKLRVPKKKPTLEFKYVLVASDGSILWENGPNRVLDVFSLGNSASQKPDTLPHILRHPLNEKFERRFVEFKVIHQCSQPSLVVAVLGSIEVMGGWHPAASIPLHPMASAKADLVEWRTDISIELGAKACFKFVEFDPNSRTVVRYEGGRDRVVLVDPDGKVGFEPIVDVWRA
mmetsp:Transcript_14320/g.39094  ORF Transcript_14320/g.39094 Transcript_14320/m.39094 type:complete len:337 (+) Transcript_14320:90-1100(+)